MKGRPSQSWARRLLNALAGGASPPGGPADRVWRSGEAPIMAPVALPDRGPGWQEVLPVGTTVQVAWTLVGGSRDGESFDVRAKVRSTLGDDAWLWFEFDLPAHLVPPSGQALVLRACRPDGLRLVPARVVEDSRGGSLLVAISDRVIRLQRRYHVRARVSLPPVSAVRLAPTGTPMGVLGVRLLDLSGGGMQIVSTEPLGRDEHLRLNLRLDDGPPVPAIVAIVDCRAGGPAGPAHACFGDLSDVERKRIVQFDYRQELDARLKSQDAGGE